MGVTLAEFNATVTDANGHAHRARAAGRERDDGLWEGWLEFEDTSTGEVFRTGRETTQPNRTDLQYWATGLSHTYLDGALRRATDGFSPPPPGSAQPPTFDGPRPASAPGNGRSREAVLNPFSVYEKSPDLLAQELTALRAWHLRQIIREYRLAPPGDDQLEFESEPELASRILQRMRELHS